MYYSNVHKFKLRWSQKFFRFPSRFSGWWLLVHSLSTRGQESSELQKESLDRDYSLSNNIPLSDSKLVSLASCSNVMEVYLLMAGIGPKMFSVRMGASSMGGSSCGSLWMDFSLLSLISLKSYDRIIYQARSCSVFTPTPTPLSSFSFSFPFSPFSPCLTNCLSSFLSSLNLYILPFSNTNIFLNQARHPQWHFSPLSISSILSFWLPMSLTTFIWSSMPPPLWMEVGLDSSPNLIVGAMPVFLVDLMLTKSPMGCFVLRDAKLEY